MFLKRLEVQGFKSFPEKIKIEFKEGITAIVGPNGSGKSNISDSIRWVIGEQSAKKLRGQTMEDIIFSGTKNRSPLGFAEVSIVLDNSNKKLSIDFDEVNITRKIYRSGESFYYINGAICRLKDIHELFMDTGIGKEGYSIIGQGKIDAILNDKSEDRRALFEEAAGIIKFKNRKHQSEAKLLETQKNLIRINDIIYESEKLLEPLKKQAEKTKKYNSLYDKLKEINIKLFVYKYQTYEQELSLIKKNIQEISLEISNLEANRQEISNLQDSLKLKKQENENRLEEVKKLLSTKNSDIYEYEKEISLNLNSIEFIKSEVNRLQIELEKSDININSKKEEISIATTNLNSNKTELNSKTQQKAFLDEEFKENNLKFNEVNQTINRYNLKITEKKQQLNNINHKVSEIKILNLQIEDQKQQYLNKLNLNKSELKQSETRIHALELELENINKKQENLVKDISKKQNLLNSLNKKNTDLTNKQERLNTEYLSLKNKRDILINLENDFEGYSKTVKFILSEAKKGNFKGVYRDIGQSITVSYKFETAIEVALGNYIQNIITETENDAKFVIKYLKKHNKGRATFLPISSMKPKTLSHSKENLLKEVGFLGIASEIIQFPNEYFNVISNILGRILIFENIDNAIDFSKKYKNSYKIVTLSGDVINTSGSLTGGSSTKKESGILSRARKIKETEQSILKITQDIKNIEIEICDNQTDRINLQSCINEESKSLQNIQIHSASINAKLHEKYRYIKKLKESLSLQEDEIKKYNVNFNEGASKLETYKKDAQKLSFEITSLEVELMNFHKNSKLYTNYNEQKNYEINNLKIEINTILNKIEIQEEKINRISTEIIEIENNKNNTKNQIILKKSDIDNIQFKNKKYYDKIKNIKKNYEETNIIYKDIQNEKLNIEEKIKNYTQNYFNTITKISNENNEKHKFDLKKQNIEQNMQQLADNIWENYSITYALAYQKYYDKNLNFEKLKDSQNKLKKELNSLGQINAFAISEYESLLKKHKLNISQRDDILKAEKDIKKIIYNLVREMEVKFKAQFELINKNFSKVFSEIFGGGTAKLILTDEENILASGIAIAAQPPGKNLQNLRLLSGGERTLTAISLLFAILKLKPSPFCILDETEAALDEANVIRYANFLKKFSHENQFIVITHKVGTMEVSDMLYGVTMEEQGISKLVSVNLSEATNF